jgi:hypothetical protein
MNTDVLVMLILLHFFVLTIQNSFRFKKLFKFLDNLYSRGIISKEEYLSFYDEHEFKRISLNPFRIFRLLPNKDNITNDPTYHNFATRNNMLTLYCITAMLILFLMLISLELSSVIIPT